MYSANHKIVKRKSPLSVLLKSVSSRPLVVVVAPMGYGKTTLAREFVDNSKSPVFFFSLPDNRPDSVRVWDSLWQEVEEGGIAEAGELRLLGLPVNEAQAALAMDILEKLPPVVIVLDDYQHRGDPGLDMFMEFAVRSDRGKCRFLIFSRALPEMNLEELQEMEVAAIHRQELLAFSKPEAKEFFLANGVMDEAAAVQDWRYSEGWAAALWLCLKSRQQEEWRPPAGDLSAMLERVVYSAYSEEDRRFLPQLSLLPSFSATDAAEVAEDPGAAVRLDRISRGNAFLGKDPASGRYQFHGIFREFLQEKLRDAGLDLPGLYRRTADCLTNRREFMAAYRYLIKAGRDQDRIRMLEILLQQRGTAESMNCWGEIFPAIQAIPWRLRLRQPLGYLAYLWLVFGDGNQRRNAAVLREAEKKFLEAESIPAKVKKRLAGEIAFLRGSLSPDDIQRRGRYYQQARKLLGGSSFLSYDRVSWSYSIPVLAFFLVQQPGGYRKGLAGLAKYWEDFVVLSGGNGAGGLEAARAEYHLERGELAEAERLLSGLTELAEAPGAHTLYILTICMRARLLLARGETETADRLLSESQPRIERTGFLEHTACHLFARLYVRASLGRTDGTPGWLTDRTVFEPPYDFALTQSFVLTLHGKVLLARNDYAGLAHLIEKSPPSLGPHASLFGRIHKKIFEALLAKQRREPDSALQNLKEALELCRPDGLALPLAEYGGQVIHLLRRLRKTIPDDPFLERILALINTASRDSGEISSYKKTLLTPRERRIMKLVVDGKTTPSIAHSLGASASTVKATLARVYAKLGAGNRADAARKFVALKRSAGHAQPVAELPLTADAKPISKRTEPALGIFLRPDATEIPLRELADFLPVFRSLTWPVLAKNPLEALAFVRLYLGAGGASGEISWWLAEAETRFPEKRRLSGEARRRILGELALTAGMLAGPDLPVLWSKFKLAESALRGQTQIHPRQVAWIHGCPQLIFACLLRAGSLDSLVESAAGEEDTLRVLSGGQSQGMATALRIERNLERCEFDKVRADVARFMKAGRRPEYMNAVVPVAFSQSRLLHIHGRGEEAIEGLQALRKRLAECGRGDLSGCLELALGYIGAGSGAGESMPESGREGNALANLTDLAVKQPFAMLVYGKKLLSTGQFERLLHVAGNMPLRFGSDAGLFARIHAKVQEAICLHRLQSLKDALAALNQAVNLSRPDGLRLGIAEYGRYVTPLLRSLMKEGGGDPFLNHLHSLAETIAGHIPEGGGSGGDNSLTFREQEIMRLAVEGMTNRSISVSLGIGESAVRKALTRIYTKLEAANRAQAAVKYGRIYGQQTIW